MTEEAQTEEAQEWAKVTVFGVFLRRCSSVGRAPVSGGCGFKSHHPAPRKRGGVTRAPLL